MRYKTVIGLEIHAELLTKTKIFCGCENTFGGEENTRVCPICGGLPGALPNLNREAVKLAAKAGFCTNCEVHAMSSFDRKNYYYPDLPKAYQITQQNNPICTNGMIGNVRINNIHIEEDAGKLLHDGESSAIDLNRCGVPLIEIVTEPDFSNAEEVCEFVNCLSARLKYAEVCDCRMEKGSLRVDVNISLMPENSKELGTRTEIKNLNSLKAVRKAIECEEKRQGEILDSGGKVIRQTMRFDEQRGITIPMREKEDLADYRYFPEPDIPPIFISEEEMSKIKNSIPKMPDERIKIYINELNVPENEAYIIAEEREKADFFENCVKLCKNPREVSKFMTVELGKRLNLSGYEMKDLKFTPEDMAELINMYSEGKINKNIQKEIFRVMFEEGKKPKEILPTFSKKADSNEIKEKIYSLAKENEKLVSLYGDGNKKAVDFFLGQIIREFGKSVDPMECKELICNVIEEILQIT